LSIVVAKVQPQCHQNMELNRELKDFIFEFGSESVKHGLRGRQWVVIG